MSASSSLRRPGYVAFAFAAYAAFLATSAYAALFVGNYFPVLGLRGEGFGNLDVPAQGPLAEAVLVNTLLIVVFGIQHSVMARQSFKAWSARFVPAPLERSVYVLASTVCLALLLVAWRPLGFVLFDVSNGPLGFLLVGLSLVGWLVAAYSTFLIDHAGLFGLRQVLSPVRARAETPEDFKTPGLYRAVRHPLYFGFLLAFWATPILSVAHLLFAALFTAYVLIAIRFEERDLVARFGDRYRDYRKRVRALVPFPR